MEYVWITGPSAIGKKTLADSLADPNNADLRKRLGIGEPVQLLGYPTELEQLAVLDGAEMGLIIWQVKQDRLIDEIAKQMPDAEQRIILVWRPFDLHLVGYKEKRLRCYANGFSAETPEEEWREALRHVRATDTDYVLKHSTTAITVVDASAGYAILPCWPDGE